MTAVTVSEIGGCGTSSSAPTLSLVAVADAPSAAQVTAVPCVARPSTAFRHLDGACRCFVGGAAPELPSGP